jgi:hypothetical protein
MAWSLPGEVTFLGFLKLFLLSFPGGDLFDGLVASTPRNLDPLAVKPKSRD